MNRFSYALALLGGLLISSCHKRDSGTKHLSNPKFKGSFTIYEPFYGSSRVFPTDTIVFYQAVFAAAENYDTYSWVVGNDSTVHTQKSFLLRFPFSETGHTLPVRLIATKNGQLDTVTKFFTIVAVKGTPDGSVTPYSVPLNYLGKFEGSYEDEPGRKFTVSIVNFAPGPDPNDAGYFGEFRVINLPEGCGGKYAAGQACTVGEPSPYNYSYPFDYTYKAFFVHDGDPVGCCPPVAFYGYMDSVNPNKIIIECNFLDTKNISRVDTLMKRKFIGYRQ